MIQKIIVIMIALFAVSAVFAQMPASGKAAVAAYQSAIRAVETGGAAGRIEAAFSALIALREALTRARGNQGTVLESISDEEFERLMRDLPGVVVNRVEVVIVDPDPEYFAALAIAHGDAADRAFFSALQATYPEAVWPVYLEQQTDYSGCTRFGSGKLVETYLEWSDFQRRFPRRYVAAARREINDVSKQLTESTCACGDVASIQDELERFLGKVKTSPVRTKVSERLQAILARRSDIRTSCTSG